MRRKHKAKESLIHLLQVVISLSLMNRQREMKTGFMDRGHGMGLQYSFKVNNSKLVIII